ncbi:MAG: protein kinase, partial [Gemmataceae bacterium]|nr:protein kinase [Gemmataceae bacterium]
ADALPPTGGPDPAATASLGPTLADRPGGRAGEVLAGRYVLREPLGEGGMGEVWAADQTEPVKRRVAVKLIKPGMDSRAVLLRFEAERQALAVMDHPGIAKVLDAGATSDGRPFFVMELVDGVPLTEYADAHRLAIPDRLELFRQVCQAVQHAHQKGVIHRDLKPSNILVAEADGKPVPKVIDFGLAKAVGGDPLTDQTLLSAAGAVMGTPLYMAPEQAGGAPDVDTRADVYALGVVLYELLTGTTPIERDTLKRAAVQEILRVIREDEPAAPSSRLSTLDALPAVAANRGTEPGRLGRVVRGDLDWVVMRALEKDRGRRYESAAAFAADIDRFLHHEPVSAGPPSALYRVRKFVRRNRAVDEVATIYDLHATVLHLLGIDHERLTYYHDGIARRLTDVHGHVLRGVLA